MDSSFPRPLSEREQALLELLLPQEFSGAEQLRMQARSVRVKALWNGLPAIVLLEVGDAAAPTAEVVHTVPVETRVRGVDPPQDVLLFVKGGMLDSIELVDYGEEEPAELPAVENVEPPTLNDGPAGSQRSRTDM